MVNKDRANTSFRAALVDLVEQNRGITLKVIAISVALLFVAAELFDEIGAYIESKNVVTYLTLIILLDLSISVGQRRKEKFIDVSRDQDDAMPTLIEAVEGCDQVDLLEYAGMTTLPLIREIRRKKVSARILICHPDIVVPMQRQRTISTLDTFYSSILRQYEGDFEIRCYKLPYAVRGRHFEGRLLEAGWLTPDLETGSAHGSINPSIIFDLSDKNNDVFAKFFKKTFEEYWTHEDTEDAKLVLDRAKSSDTEN